MTFISPSRRARRSAAGLAVVASSSVLLAGCVQITHQEGAQLEGVGDVGVTLDLCQDSTFGPGSNILLSVPGTSNCALSDLGAAGKSAQVFITYAIPSAVAAPAAIATPDGAAGDAFVADDASTAALTNGQAAPVGYKWATYRSTPTPALSSTDTAGRSGKVKAQFDVSGLSGDFNYAALVSWRFASTDPADTAYAADRAVSCGATGTFTMNGMTISAVPLPGTECRDAVTPSGFFAVTPADRSGRIGATPEPEPSATPVPDATVTTDDGFTLLSVPVNRLALSGAAEQTVTAGDSTTLTFGTKSHLAGKAVSVPLHGSTDAPGATVDTDGSLAIGTSGDVKALVKVPATTAAGDYTVKLSASAKSGLRTATGVLHVKAAPAPAAATPTPAPKPVTVTPQKALETASASLADIVQKGKKTKQLRKGAATVPVTVSGPGTVRVTIHGRKKVGKNFPIYAVGEAYAKQAGSVDVTIKRTDLGRELLKDGDVLKATLVVRFSGPNGKLVAPGIFITLD